jgi:hypothetical protein
MAPALGEPMLFRVAAESERLAGFELLRSEKVGS